MMEEIIETHTITKITEDASIEGSACPDKEALYSKVLSGVLSALAFFVGSGANAFAIVVIVVERKRLLHSWATWLTLNIAVSGLVVSVAAFSSVLGSFHVCHINLTNMIDLSETQATDLMRIPLAIVILAYVAGVYSMMILSIERYKVMKHPFPHVINTRKWVGAGVNLIIWLLSSAYVATHFIRKATEVICCFSLVVINLVPCTVTTYVCITLWWTLHRKARGSSIAPRVPSISLASTGVTSAADKAKMEARRKLALVAVVYSVANLVTCIPFQSLVISEVLIKVEGLSINSSLYMFGIFWLHMYLFQCGNPIVLYHFSSKYRQSVKIFCGKAKRRIFCAREQPRQPARLVLRKIPLPMSYG